MEIVKGEGVPDSVLLEDISENGFVNNQRIRYDKKLIYSYIGNVVISLNPFQKLDIYGKQHIEQYKGRYIYERPPHIYALTNEAYRSMTTNKENQCIIISGESGAGKTEASKIILGFIAAASKQSKDVEAINELLLQSNPIMEAFGNAKTTRNDNSSRFGKYMEIEFNYNGAPIGGKITVYLLEKSRVVTRALSERSFHCFYQMLNGLSDAELRELKLTRNVENYAYLDSSKCAKVDTINDSSDFKAVLAAAKILGFSNDEMSQIWKILAAILHLGNIKFKPNDSEGVSIANEDLSHTIASLLSISHKLFSNSLIQRTIVSGVSKKASLIIVHMNMEQAIFTRDAMAKGIYFRLFSWIVEKINLKISQQMTKMSQDKLSIGILDIYGFEVFQVNSFEQFCINWANEKLQQVFIELTLKGEQEEYEKEGIAWSHIDYFNNQVIIDLIEQKPIGIVSLMDEECTLGKSTDRTFLDKIGTQFANHNRFTVYNAVKKDPTMNPNSFKLLHYAGDVVYDVTGFLEKSKDTLYSDIIMGLQSSSLAVVSQLFPIEEERTAKRPVTVATQFKTAVNELVKTLLSCRPHYVRCIKANHQKRSFYFDEDCIKHQVRYLGLVENVRVRRAGFAYRHTYWHFLNRYKMLCKDTWPKNRTKDLKSGTESILKEHNIPTSEYQLGKTKVFVKNPKTLFYFEEKRVAKLPEVAVKIQAVWRGYWARKKYGKRKAASTILDTYKKYRFRKWFLELQKAFHNVKQDPDFGKTTTWPKPPPTLGTADVLIHKIHKTWRASQIIKRIPKEQLPYVKQKIVTCDIFKGKKPYDLQRKFEADYLDSPNIPNRNKYEQAVQTLFKRFGDTQVLFSGFVDKVNRKGKIDKRAIVITEQNIYKQNPKDYKVKTFGTEGFGIPIVDLEAISMSPNADGFVVLHVSQNVDKDALIDVGLKPEKLSELVTVLVTAYNKLTNKDLPVRFSNDIKYYLESHKKEQTSLVFQKDVTVQEPVFKKGKGKVDNVLFN